MPKSCRKVAERIDNFKYNVYNNFREVKIMYTENEFVELKRELTKDIKKEIIAFANSKGGTVYIGIDDMGRVIGLKDCNKDAEALSGMIREGIKSDLLYILI